MTTSFLAMMEAFMVVVNKIHKAQETQVTFSNGITLRTSTIHLIEAIGNYPDSNITSLAERLGVTKGAISQQIPKLIEKELIEKSFKVNNQKEVYLRLRPIGKVVYQEHAMGHQELYHYLEQELGYFSDQDQEKMRKLFTAIGQTIDSYQGYFL